MPIFNVLEFDNNYGCYQRTKSLRRQWRNECRYYDQFCFLLFAKNNPSLLNIHVPSVTRPKHLVTIVQKMKHIHFVRQMRNVMPCAIWIEPPFLSHEIIALVWWQVEILFLCTEKNGANFIN